MSKINNFIDYTGDLEIIINYGGQPFAKAKKENVKGDHLLHNIDLLNMEIIKGINQILENIKKEVLGND